MGAGGSTYRSGLEAYGYEETQCCEGIVDPISLLTTLGAIAAVSLFLRQAVIDFKIKAARRRKKSLEINEIVSTGRHI